VGKLFSYSLVLGDGSALFMGGQSKNQSKDEPPRPSITGFFEKVFAGKLGPIKTGRFMSWNGDVANH
jgi:hypothetical protein